MQIHFRSLNIFKIIDYCEYKQHPTIYYDHFISFFFLPSLTVYCFDKYRLFTEHSKTRLLRLAGRFWSIFRLPIPSITVIETH